MSYDGDVYSTNVGEAVVGDYKCGAISSNYISRRVSIVDSINILQYHMDSSELPCVDYPRS